MSTAYRDRAAAGDALADLLSGYAGRPDTVVLALVRGGVPVAARVAERLRAPLDVLVVRKLGVPWAPEVAFGALASGGVQVLNEQVVSRLEPADIDAVTAAEAGELERRERRYRGDRPPVPIDQRVVIIVDDGLATGATARAAVAAVRRLGATRVIVAVPVGSPEALAAVGADADEVVCPLAPPDFGAVSRYFADFHQVSDDEAAALLNAPGTV
ncbi:phosphoribosyltransferase [Rhizomonospora bruguierae]|uniref:phosphoribosyltransferase n=1 Tax=Rhizomonospora bruguierae TaxID=1581705 RepID=UPI001BD04F75|nr:phosphoribosyltransferase family protein [Micromonospora sp. NBRC 107566]